MVIAFQDITYSYNSGPPVLEKFSMTAESGETTVFLGPSGCGKSTLARLACGLLRPQIGRVLVSHEAARPGLVRGVLFQDDTLVPWLSVVENAVFGAKHRQPEEHLAAVGLAGAENKLPHELSAGMKKRLEFVRAKLSDDKFLIADEPFSGLDFHQRRVLWQAWRDVMRHEKRTAMLITHDLDEAISLGNRLIVLSGRTPTRIVADARVPEASDAQSRSLVSDIERALIEAAG